MLKKKPLLIKATDLLLVSGPVMASSPSVLIFGEPKLPEKLKRNKSKQKAGE